MTRPVVRPVASLDGKHGRLQLNLEVAGYKTVLRDGTWTAPLKVAKPLYLDDSGEAFIYLMNPSGGMVRGDIYTLDINLGAKAEVYLTTQSATRIYRTPGGSVGQTCTFNVGEGALLEHFPDAVIPFAGSRFHGETKVLMSEGATAFLGEILAPGRTHRGEIYQFDGYYSRTRVYERGEPILWDVIDIDPEKWDYKAVGLGEGYTHLANMFVLCQGITPELADELHELVIGFPRVLGSASLTCRRGIAVRLLGKSNHELELVLRECWALARRRLLGRPPPIIRK
ncbi:MAG: urease accessory protein UreD [Syntrophomonadaceae bacterium]|nr:urease accessory protein UreD [Syntrophomonadaceae bacterium]